jgi:hypothetical protein
MKLFNDPKEFEWIKTSLLELKGGLLLVVVEAGRGGGSAVAEWVFFICLPRESIMGQYDI